MKHSIALSTGSHCLCSCGHLVAARTRIIALVEMTEHIEQEEAKEAEEA